MTAEFAIRPARKSDASEVALLVNIAVHGGMARGWSYDGRAEGTYDPIEVGRLEMMRDDTHFGWRSATIAEHEGEVAGMMLGYRKADEKQPVSPDTMPFMRPIEELEAESAGFWFLSMLGVHIGWRGKGVGSALLQHADGKAQQTSARGLALIVEDSNQGARRLYERHRYALHDSRAIAAWSGGPPPGGEWLLMVKE